MHFLYLVYYELSASTCFEYYLLIFRRRCTHIIPIDYAAPPEDEQVVLETRRG
jgi:hypothetical protein